MSLEGKEEEEEEEEEEDEEEEKEEKEEEEEQEEGHYVDSREDKRGRKERSHSLILISVNVSICFSNYLRKFRSSQNYQAKQYGRRYTVC